MKHEKQVEIIAELLRQIDEKVNVDSGEQLRMSTRRYADPGIAQQEWQAFFRGHPQLIGLSGDLPKPGSYFTVDEFGIPVLAVRGKDGVFRVFVNTCRHRGVRVAQAGRGEATRFICPFHSWTYSNQGELVGIPQQAHFGEVDKACNSLIELPAVEWHGLLFVHPQVDGAIDPEALLEGFSDEIANTHFGELVYVGESTIDMKLNWKLANDTFGETYHFQRLHRDTLGQIFYGDNLHYEVHGRNHRFCFANRGIDALRDVPQNEWNVHDVVNYLYFLFPNIQFNVGGGKSVSLIKIYPHPDDPGRSISRISFYLTAEALAGLAAADSDTRVITGENVYEFDRETEAVFSPSAFAEVFLSTIEQEDYLMGESTQRAIESGMLKTVQFGRNEPALHHYHRTYSAALGIEGPVVIASDAVKGCRL